MCNINKDATLVSQPYSLVLECDLTAENFRTMMAELCLPRQYVGSLLAFVIVCLAVWVSFSSGFNWWTLLFLLFALYQGIPRLRERLFWRVFSAFCRIPTTRLRIEIDEDRIVTETLSDDPKLARKETVNWEDYTDSGSVNEMKSWFALESKPRFPLSPQHGVLIPKAAFASEGDLSNFREYLKQKMGE